MKRLHLLTALALVPLSLALGQSLFSAMEVQAQNTQCSDRQLGDSTNACANTRFVGAAITASAISPGGSPTQVQYNNSGAFGGLSEPSLTAKILPFSSTARGAVNPPGAGVTSTFLRADNTFASAANNCPPLISLFTTGTNAVFAATTCNGLFPLSIELDLWAGGGSGAGNGATPTAASAGGSTCWNSTSPACSSPLYSATGGAAGAIGALAGAAAAGGTGVTCDINDEGGRGGPGEATGNRAGGAGGQSTLGGGAPAGILVAVNGVTAAAFSASGGSGASTGGAPVGSGGGGAAGGHCKKLLVSPVPSAAFYTIGGPGIGGTGTVKGGDGANGRIQIIQRW